MASWTVNRLYLHDMLYACAGWLPMHVFVRVCTEYYICMYPCNCAMHYLIPRVYVHRQARNPPDDMIPRPVSPGETAATVRGPFTMPAMQSTNTAHSVRPFCARLLDTTTTTTGPFSRPHPY
ncbi:hypothetical protein LY76DRAFT_301200 [Colletotrichum caudatum]|nr:hypothetical protein LY76DRAFT_301200 [Colletotrichum caudatum]